MRYSYMTCHARFLLTVINSCSNLVIFNPLSLNIIMRLLQTYRHIFFLYFSVVHSVVCGCDLFSAVCCAN